MEFRYISLHVKVLCVSGRVFILFCPYACLCVYVFDEDESRLGSESRCRWVSS